MPGSQMKERCCRRRMDISAALLHLHLHLDLTMAMAMATTTATDLLCHGPRMMTRALPTGRRRTLRDSLSRSQRVGQMYTSRRRPKCPMCPMFGCQTRHLNKGPLPRARPEKLLRKGLRIDVCSRPPQIRISRILLILLMPPWTLLVVLPPRLHLINVVGKALLSSPC